jgi:hypothetical protein
MSKREEQEKKEISPRHHQEAVNRSFDETKDNVSRAIDEVRRESPRYSQIVSDFHNETSDAMREITITFLDSQKEVVNSMQSAWAPFAERAGSSGDRSDSNYPLMNMMQPWWGWWWTGISPKDMATMYARNISVMTDFITASTRMVTNMMFAGIEASRAATNYARYGSKEIARVTSISARMFGQTTRETVSKLQEAGPGGTTTTTTGRTEK